MRYRHLFLGFLGVHGAALLTFAGCDLSSGGTGTGPGPGTDSGIDTGVDAGPGGPCPDKNIQTDSENCGECNHSCLGGQCAEGKCVPVRLAQISGATELALDDGGLVVTAGGSSGKVFYVPLPGDGGAPISIASEQVFPRGPSVEGPLICWATGETVSCSAQGSGSIKQIKTGEFGPIATVIIDGDVYWLLSGNGRVRRASADGGAYSEVAEYPSTANAALVRDGDRLFWLSQRPGALVAAPADGGDAAVVSTLPDSGPASIAFRGDLAYVAVSGTGDAGGGLYRVAKDGTGGTATVIRSQTLSKPYIAIDGQHVYFTDTAGGTVFRVPLDAAGPNAAAETVVAAQSSPTGIQVDDKFVYWANSAADGGLMRLAK